MWSKLTLKELQLVETKLKRQLKKLNKQRSLATNQKDISNLAYSQEAIGEQLENLSSMIYDAKMEEGN